VTEIVQPQRSRGAAVGIGLAMALAGVVLLVWPGPTTFVLVSMLGLAIVAYGVFELLTALRGDGQRSRLWSGVIGAVAVLGGIAIFVTPAMGTVTLGLVIGWVWLIEGVVGIIGAVVEPGSRLVRLLIAGLSLVAGLVVLAQPGLSLVTLVWFAGAWILAAGVVMVAVALFGHRRAVAPT
jgi:uncharacterized membrane protein HdeD (DUF308 family)